MKTSLFGEGYPNVNSLSRRLRIEAAGQTHVGRKRTQNEDRFALFPSLGLFLVADGMGGTTAGAIAAEMAVVGIREMFEDVDATLPLGVKLECRRGRSLLVAAIQRAN